MGLNTQEEEREWILRLGRGDEAAWAELYRAYQGRVYRFAWQMCGQASVAEEVTQATFVAFLEGYRRYDPERGALLGWLLGIARRQVLSNGIGGGGHGADVGRRRLAGVTQSGGEFAGTVSRSRGALRFAGA